MTTPTATGSVEVGQKAPDFTLPAPGGRKVSLSDYLGKKNVVLAFYPLDWSPICSLQLPSLQQQYSAFVDSNTAVLGISIDSVYSHSAFARELGLKFDLLADFNPKGEVARRYGVYREADGYNDRATVIVDKEGIVRFKQVHPIKEIPDVAEILQFVGTLNP